jgi:hypothetical protein
VANDTFLLQVSSNPPHSTQEISRPRAHTNAPKILVIVNLRVETLTTRPVYVYAKALLTHYRTALNTLRSRSTSHLEASQYGPQTPYLLVMVTGS